MLVDGYVRVSQVAGVRGPFISPAVQRAEIERWAVNNHAVVAMCFEELDQSGSRNDRPLLLEANPAGEAGDTDGLVVPYLSRFGGLIDWMVAIRGFPMQAARSSPCRRTSTSRPTRPTGARMLFSIAEWERDR